MSFLGLVSAVAILVGTLEPAGFAPAADIVVAGYILWSVWMMVFGFVVLRTSPVTSEVARMTAPIGQPLGGGLVAGARSQAIATGPTN
jgi:hypothetical protein